MVHGSERGVGALSLVSPSPSVDPLIVSPVGALSPLSLPSLWDWFDPSQSATVTLTTGKVSGLRDLSGNANHLTQAAAGSRPTITSAGQNGLDILHYAGTGCFDAPAKTFQDFTFFAVLKPNADDYGIWSNSTGNYQVRVADSGGNTMSLFPNAAPTQTSASCPNTILSNWNVLIWRRVSGVVTFFQDGKSVANISAINSTDFVTNLVSNFAAVTLFDTDQGEFGRCTVGVSDAQCYGLMAYLKAKWGGR